EGSGEAEERRAHQAAKQIDLRPLAYEDEMIDFARRVAHLMRDHEAGHRQLEHRHPRRAETAGQRLIQLDAPESAPLPWTIHSTSIDRRGRRIVKAARLQS